MAAGRPPRVAGVIAACHRPAALQAAAWAIDWLQHRDLRVLVDPQVADLLEQPELGSDRLYDDADLLIVFGGDGTLITTGWRASAGEVPVVGVNFGTFGFLSAIEAARLEDGLTALLAGEYLVEHRLMLEAKVTADDGEAEVAYAANDIALKAADPSHVLELVIHADGELIAEFPADGLVIATPTGSTAYNLSAGGPVVMPGVEAMVLTPLCPHTLATRPIVLNPGTTLTIALAEVKPGREAFIAVDGRRHYELTHDGTVVIRRASRTMQLVRLHQGDFFASLRGKLRWGKPK